MKLQELTISNFQGIKNFTFSPFGGDASVYGTNATGKTALANAYAWLLTDKDSQNCAQFSIKPIGMKKGADVEVEGIFELNGKSLALKKVYSEVWTKKRGAATKEFSGHTTTYFVNGVPSGLKGFSEKIAEIADPALFRVLTNPRHVNEEMKWQDRRELLIEFCGGVSNTDVIKQNPEFSGITKLVEEKTLDECRLEAEYARKGINKELLSTPVRIDELQKSLPEKQEDPKMLVKEKGEIGHQIFELQDKISTIENGGALGVKKRELLEIENRIGNSELKINRELYKKVDRQKTIVRSQDELFLDAKGDEKSLSLKIEDLKAAIKRLATKREGLLIKWDEEAAVQFVSVETCPTCNQSIPDEQIQMVRAKFNTEKANKLADITAQGQSVNNESDTLKAEAEVMGQAYKTAVKDTEAKEKACNEATAKLREMTAHQVEVTPEHKKLTDKRDEIRLEISRLEIEGGEGDTADIKAEIEALETQKAEIGEKISSIKQDKKTKDRIKELEAQEKKLAGEYENLEAKLQLLEDFTRAKCAMLTNRINSKFKITEFTLFENQINGGLKDVCIATVDGVPYPDVNNAAQINCGIDIINALSEHYGVDMPLFIDNAESIVEIHPTESQMILLTVSEGDEVLRVEAQGEQAREAA